MQDSYEVTLGGKPYPLRYTSADMRALQVQFQFQSPAAWVIEQVLGLRLLMGATCFFNLQAQVALLAAGLARGTRDDKMKRKLAEHQYVEELLDRELADGRSLLPILWTAAEAAFASGVVTRERFDLGRLERHRALFFSGLLEAPDGAATGEAPTDDWESTTSSPASSHSTTTASDNP